MNRWSSLFRDGPRVVAGIMSGTSLDGVDVAVVRLEGSGRNLKVELLDTISEPFSDGLAAELRLCAEAVDHPVDALCRLGPRMSLEYARLVRRTSERVDLVGCHGQTIRHQPEPAEFADETVRATWQVVDGQALSAHLGLPVVTDFRSADVALGGQGAPLVPYVDWVLLTSDTEDRVALNIGGIANVTALRRRADRQQVTAFDTGPGNMLMDILATRYLGKGFDEDGRAASAGNVQARALEAALAHPFFERQPPKSAGRQAGEAGFGQSFADRFVEQCGAVRPEDLLATAAELTAVSIARAVDRFVPFVPDRVIVSGGGARNPHLMARLEAHLPAVSHSGEFGLDGRFKEAIAFAILAHETVNGVATGMPSVTGATRAAVLGAISWP